MIGGACGLTERLHDVGRGEVPDLHRAGRGAAIAAACEPAAVGSKCEPRDRGVESLKIAQPLPGGDIPDLDGSVLCRWKPAIGRRAERDAGDVVGVAAQGLGDRGSGRVPDPDCQVRTGGGQRTSVGGKRDAGDAGGADLTIVEGDRSSIGGRVPDLDGAVCAGGSKLPAVGAESQGTDGTEMTAERQDLSAGGGLPDSHVVIFVSGGELATVGAKRQAEHGARAVEREDRLLGLIGSVFQRLASHTRVPPSVAPTASCRPSGLNVTLETVLIGSRSVRISCPLECVSDLHGAAPGCRCEMAAVGGKRHASDDGLEATQVEGLRVMRQVPEEGFTGQPATYCVDTCARCGQLLAVVAERHAPDGSGLAEKSRVVPGRWPGPRS